jgi:hypothetical protein
MDYRPAAGKVKALDRIFSRILTKRQFYRTICRMSTIYRAYPTAKAAPASRRRLMLSMRAKGVKDVDIAAKFGISKQRVLQILKAKKPRGPRNGKAAG